MRGSCEEAALISVSNFLTRMSSSGVRLTLSIKVCRGCVQRTLEVTNPETETAALPVCPMTRIPLEDFAMWIHSAADHLSVNRALEQAILKFFPAEYEERKQQVQEEMKEHMSEDTFVPVFVCTVAWPGVSTPLHIFEPRYRLVKHSLKSGCEGGD